MWKSVSGVVIGKPGQDDYAKLKVYPTISLLSCMKKVVEYMVAELLAEEPEGRGRLSEGQYGSRKRRSPIDVAALTADRAHTAWRDGHTAGVLLLDIKAAFPSIGRRLIHTMRGKGMDGVLVQWMASILTDRRIEMVIEGNVVQRHPVDAGIPQGTPVSMIVFTIQGSGLIQLVEAMGTGAESLSFVVDVR
jgi:hypothetical protein